jgi:hypothetical protein
VTPAGRLRSVIIGPMRYKVLDIAADGRVLITHDRDDKVVEALLAGSPTPVEVSLRANSSATWVADDGSSTLIADLATESYQTYFLRAGSTPVLLGRGQPASLSPDGHWAVAAPVEGRPLFVHPTGAGESRQLPNPDDMVFDSFVDWLDNSHVIGFGHKLGESSYGYVQDVAGGPPQRFTPEGMTAKAAKWWTLPLSRDRTRVVGVDEHGATVIFPVSGGAPQPVAGLRPDDVVVQWSEDGHGLLAGHREGSAWSVERLDLASGQRTPAMTIRAQDPAGLRLSVFGISPNAKYYVHTYARLLSDLYVVDGLR